MLYLVPCHLGNPQLNLLPSQIVEVLSICDVLFVENLKTGRHYLKDLKIEKAIDDYEWILFDKNSNPNEITNLGNLLATKNCAFMSEAGLPAIADPGAKLVQIAHANQVTVIPLTGPSSIFLALMASGFNGQLFTFNGYLPIDKVAKSNSIKMLEQQVNKQNQTQIFIETPYRNQTLFNDLITNCSASTLLCVACNITLPSQFIYTATISYWKKNIPELNKQQCVFILGKF
jgi:16S rRNA (cytidine1402-2'-O)-methyltransferase